MQLGKGDCGGIQMEAGHLGSSPNIAIDSCDPEGARPHFWTSENREALSHLRR